MKPIVLTAFLISWPGFVAAGESELLLERLIAETWKPSEVRVEWQFKGKVSDPISDTVEWRLADFRPTRLAGSMILVLERSHANRMIEKKTVSGIARIFGSSFTPTKRIHQGQPVDSMSVVAAELEWTYLRDNVADQSLLAQPLRAARTLMPGRPLVKSDVELIPVIQRDQAVDVQYIEGAVRIRMAGRALQDGAVGETIAVVVDLGKTRRFEGTVISDGTVQVGR